MLERINSREEMIAKREEYAKALNAQSKQILICGGTGCVAGGSLKIYDRLKQMMEERGIKCTIVLGTLLSMSTANGRV